MPDLSQFNSQDYRVTSTEAGIFVQFKYKGYEISLVSQSHYAIIDVVVYENPNSQKVVFRGLTVEHCIDWINTQI